MSPADKGCGPFALRCGFLVTLGALCFPLAALQAQELLPGLDSREVAGVVADSLASSPDSLQASVGQTSGLGILAVLGATVLLLLLFHRRSS